MTDLSKLVTVVIPTIEERSDYLRQAIESATSQTIGSPSVTYKVDNYRVGPAEIRNDIMRTVQTPWALFLDDDDILHPDYFETVLPFLDDHDMVYTWCVEQGFSASLDRPFDGEALRHGNYIPVTAMMRTGMFKEVGGFPTDCAYEDYGLWLRLLDVGARFKCIEEKKWTYRRHDGSRTHTQQVLVATGQLREA